MSAPASRYRAWQAQIKKFGLGFWGVILRLLCGLGLFAILCASWKLTTQWRLNGSYSDAALEVNFADRFVEVCCFYLGLRLGFVFGSRGVPAPKPLLWRWAQVLASLWVVWVIALSGARLFTWLGGDLGLETPIPMVAWVSFFLLVAGTLPVALALQHWCVRPFRGER